MPPRSDPRLGRRLCAAVLTVAATALVGGVASAASAAERKAPTAKTGPAKAATARKPPAKSAPSAAARPAQRQRELQTEQQRLQARLAQTKRQLAAAEASHSEATDALRESEAAISSASRRLRELAAQRRQVEQQIAALQERSRNATARQSQEERQLGQVLRAQLALSQQPAWAPLLAPAPQQAAQDSAYLGYLARAGAQTIGQLTERREELAQLESESRERQLELVAIAGAEEDSRQQLLKQQAARKQTLDRLARQISSQRQSIATLERDEQRLGSLIEELGKVLAEQARREAQQRERLRRQAAADPKNAPSDAAKAAERSPSVSPGRPLTPADVEPPADSRFAQLRGKLAMPVQGEVTARFGAQRRTEAGVDAPTWKGIFIRAREGSEVHAVAAGRVVFADWLRGFGNLLILDHGEGFLSVYGNNETLLANAGERIAAGAVIATVGNTGGQREPGLYFELRFQGRPFDPLRWAAAR